MTTQVKNITKEYLLEILETVKDPEVPVLSIMDLGIVRNLEWITVSDEKGYWKILITPTYSGCPAMDMITTQIRMTLFSHSIHAFDIQTVLSPAWTTDWMTESGKQKLFKYGIAPPHPMPGHYMGTTQVDSEPVVCTHCNSTHTHRISEFGSTACKALYQCDECMEPFDYFKCH